MEVGQKLVIISPGGAQPSREERARHELTHLPFRPWCTDCVTGRVADEPHRRVTRDGDTRPPKVFVAHNSERFRWSRGQGASCPARRELDGRSAPSRQAWQVCLAGWWRNSTKNLDHGCHGGSLPLKQLSDHWADGSVEKAVRDVRDRIRAMMCALTHHVGSIRLTQPVFDCMVPTEVQTRIREPRLAEFGKQTVTRRAQARTQGEVQPRWRRETHFDSRWSTAEHWVAEENGTARRVRSIWRVPLADRS